MECVQLPLLLCTKGPELTAVQECAQDTGSIDLDLGICRQLLVKPYSLCESREHGSCFSNVQCPICGYVTDNSQVVANQAD